MSLDSFAVQLPGAPQTRSSIEQCVIYEEHLVFSEPQRVFIYGVHAYGVDLGTAVETRSYVERIARLVFYFVILLEVVSD